MLGTTQQQGRPDGDGCDHHDGYAMDVTSKEVCLEIRIDLSCLEALSAATRQGRFSTLPYLNLLR